MIHPLFALFDPGTDTALEKFSVTIGGLAAAAWYIRQLFSRKPSHPPNEQLENLHKALAQRVEIAEAAISGIRSEMKTEAEKVEKSARDRSLHIYSKMDELRKELTSAIEATRQASSEAHDETRGEMARGFQDMERALGRLEGKLEK